MGKKLQSNISIICLGLLGLVFTGCGTVSGSLNPGGRADDAPAPVQILSVSHGKVTSGAPIGIQVTWTRSTAPEAQGYYLYRDTQSIPDPPPDGTISPSLRVNGGNLIAQPPSGATVTYNDLFDPVIGETYYYRVTVVDDFGNESYPSNEMDWTVHGQTVSGLNPGAAYWGDSITITGDTFGDTYEPATDAVLFELLSGTLGEGAVTSWSASEIRVNVPNNAVTGPVYVRIEGTLAATDDDLQILNPYIYNITPQTGFVEQPLLINGENFGAAAGSSKIFLAGVDITAGVTSWSNNQLEVIVPFDAQRGDIEVEVDGHRGNGELFIPRAEILSTSEIGAAGETLTLTGRYFGDTEGTLLLAGSPLNILSWTDTAVTAEIAGTPGIFPLDLRTSASVTSNTVQFEVDVPLALQISGLDTQPLYRTGDTATVRVQTVANADLLEIFADDTKIAQYQAGVGDGIQPDFEMNLPLMWIGNGPRTISARVTRRATALDSNELSAEFYTLVGDINADMVIDVFDQDVLQTLLGLTSEDAEFRVWYDTDNDSMVTEADLAQVGYNFGDMTEAPDSFPT